jgi:hypothetical protein
MQLVVQCEAEGRGVSYQKQEIPAEGRRHTNNRLIEVTSQLNIRQLIAELQKRADQIKLWGADLLDRLKFDYESGRRMEVLTSEDPAGDL